jgi:phosphatidylserine/phosphatidylglycerophosphate/cardiolipin synthase-like enzyme
MRAFWTISFALVFGSAVLCAQDPPLPDLLLSPLPELRLPAGLEVHFAPAEDLEQLLVSAIDGARSEVLVNHTVLTSSAILDALGRAYAKKRMVLVMLDAAPSVRDYQGFVELRRRSVPAVPLRRAAGRWNNMKYLIIDRAKVWTGTADLTPRIAHNDDVLLGFEEPSVVITFYNHFVRIARGQPAQDAPQPSPLPRHD